MKLDQIDRHILAELQDDGRMTINDLADKVGLSPTPCLRRVKRLQHDGVIKSYAAHVDQEAIGLPVSVFVNVTLMRQVESELQAFEAAVAACPEVMECYLMTGTSDYLLRIVAADLFAYERFLKSILTQIPGIANIQSSFALRQVVHRSALPVSGM
ncbi:Lrp/AsnC family transcriptional regulator [Roseibium aggregatum]|uniref:Lrp/AsnC family transcriptional regulator n=1 Tax=Roseibium aggregatum TaxID=187304 RepID=A0A926P469_9HYPH|nr:Lrp/AsnC family transcriptional regulator [Roseibium aggregatum]MBD1549483.1 Lrp/AsnC family transcriptional regulator [Roseibium aggregatum]